MSSDSPPVTCGSSSDSDAASGASALGKGAVTWSTTSSSDQRWAVLRTRAQGDCVSGLGLSP